MRFGVCCSLDQVPEALAAGYDYVELPAGRVFLVDPISPDRIRELRGETTNLFAVGHLNLTEVNAENREYGERLIPLAAAAGVSVMVVGSGPARRAAEGQDIESAEKGFADVSAVFSEIGRKQGVVIAPESLKRAETNVGNSLGDLARRLDKRGVAFTADSHHLLRDWADRGNSGVPDDAFWDSEIPFRPAHVHLSAFDRGWRVNDGSLVGFVRRLRELGYDERVSLECEWEDFSAEIGWGLAEARRLFEVSGGSTACRRGDYE